MRLAFRNRKYFITNFASRPGSGRRKRSTLSHDQPIAGRLRL
jgi:hypothetical protein